MNHPCPIPKEKLARNTPNYTETYSFGDPSGTDTDKIYCADNFVKWTNTQQEALKMAGKDIPIFSYEFPKGGARKFTACSMRAMMKKVASSEDRFMYWFVHEDRCVNFYVDFDLTYSDMTEESRQTRCLNYAMEEFLSCLDEALTEQSKNTRTGHFDFGHDYTVSRLDGNRDSKESTHLIFHFPGPRMFKSQYHCKYFFAHILRISHARHPDKSRNPLYFCHADTREYRCIADISVYTRNRNWRCLSCYKNKEKPSQIGGALYPPCPHRIQTGKLLCEDKHCRKHVFGEFTEHEWCENDPMFIPRLRSGAQAVPIILEVPLLEIGDFKKNSGAGNAVALTSFLSNSMYYESRLAEDSNPSAIVSGGASPMSLSATRTIVGSDATLINAALALLNSIIDYPARVSRHIDDNFILLSCPEDKRCCYKYKRHHSRYTYNSLEQDAIKTMEHQHNHIQFLLKLDHPLPWIYIHCTDEDCKDYIKQIQTKRLTDFKVQTVDVRKGNETYKKRYTDLSLDLLRRYEVSSVLFNVDT